jgi:predicted PurR-regulated permease PerM
VSLGAPRWRAKLLMIVLAFVAVVAAAWVYVPELKDGAGVLWGDAKTEAKQRM